MDRIGVITGLLSEAECLDVLAASERPAIEVAGANAMRARAKASALVSRGCRALLSFGVAGGLDPALRAGDLVLAQTVRATDGQTFATDAAWRERLETALDGLAPVATAGLAGSDRMIAAPAEKAALRLATGAAAVDMESHGVARAANEAGVPFLVLRAISDGAADAIPEWVLDGVAADGSLDPKRIAARLFGRPWSVWSLIGAARNNGRALASLRRVAVLAGGRFCFA